MTLVSGDTNLTSLQVWKQGEIAGLDLSKGNKMKPIATLTLTNERIAG